MDIVYLMLKKKSNYFFLMRKSIFKNGIKLENENNYVYSSSRLYENRKRFKKYLKQYNLELESRTQNIIGNELDIRFLYFQFFWGNYRGVEWPFDTIPREEFIQEIGFYDSQLVKNMSELQKEQFLYWLAIFKIREKEGKLIGDKRFKLAKNFFKVSEDIKELMFKMCNINKDVLSVEANYLYFIFTLTTGLSGHKQKLLECLEKDLEKFKIYRVVFNLVGQFKKKFSLDPTKDYATIYFSIYKLFLLETIYKGNFRESDFVAIPNRIVPRQYESDFSLFYSEIMVHYGRKYLVNDYLQSKLLFFLSFIINFNFYQPEIKVKLLSSSGDIFEYVVIEKIKSLANNIVLKNFDAKDVDIIISDCMVSISEKERIFYWSAQPTDQEWDDLTTTLKVIEQSKNAS